MTGWLCVGPDAGGGVMVAMAMSLAAVSVLVWPSGARWTPPAGGRPGEQAPSGDGVAREQPATVEEAAAALTLVAAALRSGMGSLEALEAVARLCPDAAGRELAIVAAAQDLRAEGRSVIAVTSDRELSERLERSEASVRPVSWLRGQL